jgi:hypothetical protein
VKKSILKVFSSEEKQFVNKLVEAQEYKGVFGLGSALTMWCQTDSSDLSILISGKSHKFVRTRFQLG